MMKQMQYQQIVTKNSKGFSLIEMVITVGIIAIIIVALATMGIFTLKKASESNNKSRALRFAQEAVEGIRYYRDVDKIGFGSLVESAGASGAGNYVLIMGTGEVGWNLVTTAVIKDGSTDEEKFGCQDPVYDVASGVYLKSECERPLLPYFKRKIEVTNIDIDTVTSKVISVDFRITVWWENGNDSGVKGKKIIMTTTLAK